MIHPAGASEVGSADEVWWLAHPLRGFAVARQSFDGRPFRIPTVPDVHGREALPTVPGTSSGAARVVGVLEQLARVRGRPKSLRVDDGPEFAGRPLDHWA